MQRLALNGNGQAVRVTNWWDEIEDDAARPTALSTPYGAVTVEYALVTPEMAREFLSNMGTNRNPKQKQVAELKAAMSAGLFAFNGEPLIVDDSGKLMDGQHRCLACMQSGASFPALIVRGIRRSTFDTIDQSTRRTAGDVFHMQGHEYASLCAAIVRLLLAHDRHNGFWNVGAINVTIRELELAFQRYPAVLESVRYGNRTYRVGGGSHALASALHWLMAQKDRDLANRFFESVGSGENLSADDPAFQLRKALLSIRQGKHRPITREVCALYVHAWNAARQGRKLRQLKGLIGDANPVIM